MPLVQREWLMVQQVAREERLPIPQERLIVELVEEQTTTQTVALVLLSLDILLFTQLQ
jgi:hypothetical protein